MSATAELATRLKEHLVETEAELDRCRGALAALVGPEPDTSRSRPVRAPARRRQRKGMNVETILAAANGNSARQIAEQVGLGYQATLRWLTELQETGLMRREGERDKTRWTANPSSGRKAT